MQWYGDLTFVVFATLVKVLECQSYHENKDVCTDKEIQTASCINGQCFILKLNDYREASCHCYQGYAGSRCQEINIELLSFASSNVYIILGVIVLVMILACIIFIICYRRMKGHPLSDVFSSQSYQKQNDQLIHRKEDSFELHSANVDKRMETSIPINGRADTGLRQT